MRKDQVTELIEDAKRKLSLIEEEYKNSLKSKVVSASLRISIKNYFENLRSALDYIAHDIYDLHIHPYRVANGGSRISNVYFPYGKTASRFASGIRKSLPDLESVNNPLYKVLESVQPHSCGDNWLPEFCGITNEKKHDSLTPQTRTETRTLTAKAGGASISMPIDCPGFSVFQGDGCRVMMGGVPVKFIGKDIIPLSSGLSKTITTWVSFKFSGTEIIVLPFLKKVFTQVNQLSKKIYGNI